MNFKVIILIGACFYSFSFFAIENIDETAIIQKEKEYENKLVKAKQLFFSKQYCEALSKFQEVYNSYIPLKIEASAYLAEIYRFHSDIDKALQFHKEISEQNDDIYFKNFSLFSMAFIYYYKNNKKLCLPTLLQVDFSQQQQIVIKPAFILAVAFYHEGEIEKAQILIDRLMPKLNIESAYDVAEKSYNNNIADRAKNIRHIINLLNISFEQNNNIEIKLKAAFLLAKINYSELKGTNFYKSKDYFNYFVCQLIKIQKVKELSSELMELKEKAQYYLQLIEVKEKSV